jgi:hypothetical protein
LIYTIGIAATDLPLITLIGFYHYYENAADHDTTFIISLHVVSPEVVRFAKEI